MEPLIIDEKMFAYEVEFTEARFNTKSRVGPETRKRIIAANNAEHAIDVAKSALSAKVIYSVCRLREGEILNLPES